MTNALPRHDHRALLLRPVPQQSMIDEVKGRSADVDDPLDVDDDDDDMLADMPDLDEIYVDKAAAVAAQRQQEQSVEEDDSDDDMCGVCDEDGELLLCDGCDQGCVELSAAFAPSEPATISRDGCSQRRAQLFSACSDCPCAGSTCAAST